MATGKSESNFLAVFGGHFHPAHLGHLNVVEHYHRAYPHYKVCIVPSFKPPHKQPATLFSHAQGLALLHLLFDHLDYVEISGYEINKRGVSYSIETIEHLFAKYTPTLPIHFLIGDDLVEDIHHWKDIEMILTKVCFITFHRQDTLDSINPRIPKDKIHYLNNAVFKASSTNIREAIDRRDWNSIHSLLNKKQIKYLQNTLALRSP